MVHEVQGLSGKIESVRVGDELTITTECGKTIVVKDDGQLCCESRYVHCDDELEHFVGRELTGRVVTKSSVSDADCGVRECMFVEIGTTIGAITLVTHNVHSGYYGGFDVGVSVDGVRCALGG